MNSLMLREESRQCRQISFQQVSDVKSGINLCLKQTFPNSPYFYNRKLKVCFEIPRLPYCRSKQQLRWRTTSNNNDNDRYNGKEVSTKRRALVICGFWLHMTIIQRKERNCFYVNERSGFILQHR